MNYSGGNIRMWSRMGAAGALGASITELMQRDERVVVCSADMTVTSGIERAVAKFPDRHYEFGIAEQNMVNVAAGMAGEGLIPYAFTFATFFAMRALDQIKVSLGYMGLNVKLVGVRSGVGSGLLGPTHIAVEDVAVMRAIPNITIVCPCDGAEIVKAMIAASEWNGPIYIRLTGGNVLPIVHAEDFDFQIGKAVELSTGSDVQIFATGCAVSNAVIVADQLTQHGISCGVTDMHTIRPLDAQAIIPHARAGKLIVTLEEHNINGGLGSAVCECVCDSGLRPPLLRCALPDCYPDAACQETILREAGLTPDSVAARIFTKLREEKK